MSGENLSGEKTYADVPTDKDTNETMSIATTTFDDIMRNECALKNINAFLVGNYHGDLRNKGITTKHQMYKSVHKIVGENVLDIVILWIQMDRNDGGQYDAFIDSIKSDKTACNLCKIIASGSTCIYNNICRSIVFPKFDDFFGVLSTNSAGILWILAETIFL